MPSSQDRSLEALALREMISWHLLAKPSVPPTDRRLPDHATSRAVALNVREPLTGKLFNRRMQRVHGPKHSRRDIRAHPLTSMASRQGCSMRRQHKQSDGAVSVYLSALRGQESCSDAIAFGKPESTAA